MGIFVRGLVPTGISGIISCSWTGTRDWFEETELRPIFSQKLRFWYTAAGHLILRLHSIPDLWN